jgi:hypothetical protein
MAWAMVIPAMIAAGAEIYKMSAGASQARRGRKKLDSLQRPEYTIPKEVQEQLMMSRMQLADNTLPGQGVAQDRQQLAAQNAMQAAAMTGRGQAMIPAIQAQEQQGIQNILSQQQSYRLQNLANLNRSLQMMAGYRDTEWQLNKFAPYADDRKWAEDMIGAGNMNLYSGLTGLAAVGMSTTNNMIQAKAYADAMSGGQNNMQAQIDALVGQARQAGLGQALSGSAGAVGDAATTPATTPMQQDMLYPTGGVGNDPLAQDNIPASYNEASVDPTQLPNQYGWDPLGSPSVYNAGDPYVSPYDAPNLPGGALPDETITWPPVDYSISDRAKSGVSILDSLNTIGGLSALQGNPQQQPPQMRMGVSYPPMGGMGGVQQTGMTYYRQPTGLDYASEYLNAPAAARLGSALRELSRFKY